MQCKSTAFPFPAVHEKISIVHQHDLLAQRKTDPRARFLRGKERRKDLLLNLCGHPDTIVLHLDLDMVIGLDG